MEENEEGLDREIGKKQLRNEKAKCLDLQSVAVRERIDNIPDHMRLRTREGDG